MRRTRRPLPEPLEFGLFFAFLLAAGLLVFLAATDVSPNEFRDMSRTLEEPNILMPLLGLFGLVLGGIVLISVVMRVVGGSDDE